MSTTQPIVNLPNLYANAGSCRVLTNTTFNFGPGIFRDSTNTNDINIGNFLSEVYPNQGSTTTIIDLTTNGVNGLDTGSLAANTFYYVFAIGDSTGFQPSGVIASTSSSAPLLPFGYNLFRRCFNLRTDGSSHLLLCTITGNSNQRIYQYYNPINIVNTTGSTTPVTVALNTAIPPGSYLIGTGRGQASFRLSFTPATAGNSISIKPTTSATYPTVVSGPVISQAFKAAPIVMLTDATIDYITTSASDAIVLDVMGYLDFI